MSNTTNPIELDTKFDQRLSLYTNIYDIIKLTNFLLAYYILIISYRLSGRQRMTIELNGNPMESIKLVLSYVYVRLSRRDGRLKKNE